MKVWGYIPKYNEFIVQYWLKKKSRVWDGCPKRKNNFKKEYFMFSSSHDTCILKTRAEKKEVRYRNLNRNCMKMELNPSMVSK